MEKKSEITLQEAQEILEKYQIKHDPTQILIITKLANLFLQMRTPSDPLKNK